MSKTCLLPFATNQRGTITLRAALSYRKVVDKRLYSPVLHKPDHDEVRCHLNDVICTKLLVLFDGRPQHGCGGKTSLGKLRRTHMGMRVPWSSSG